MCLTSIRHVFNPPSEAVHTGYKVVLYSNTMLSTFTPLFGVRPIFPLNQWVKDFRNQMLQCERTPHKYPTGFHVFTSLGDAKLYCFRRGEVVVKVHYTNTIIRGEQHIHGNFCDSIPVECDVCRDIMVVEVIR